MKNILPPFLLIVCFTSGWLRAQNVPSLINYQGVLVNPAGVPLAAGDYTVSLSIWDQATGGNTIWGHQVFDDGILVGHGPKVTVTSNGFFNVVLGDRDTNAVLRLLTGAFTAKDRFIEITVGNGPPIEPRQRILSAPFALRADNADKVGNQPAANVALKNGANLFTVAPQQITINAPANKGLIIKAAASQSANLLELLDSANATKTSISPAGNLAVAGTVTASGFSGSGASLTALNAASVSSGTLLDARLSPLVVREDLANTFTVAPQQITINAPANKGLIIKGAASQTANLLELQDNGGAVKASISPAGDVKLGAAGDLFAPGAVERLRLIRGRVSASGASTSGSGFSVINLAAGHYQVTYDTPFPGFPSMTVTPVEFNGPQIATISSYTTSAFEVKIWTPTSTLVNSEFFFLVAGPR